MCWLLSLFFLIGTVNASVEIDTSLQWWISDTLVRQINPVQEPNGIDYFQRYFILLSIDKDKCSIQSADLQGNKLFLSMKSEGVWIEKTCFLSEVQKIERTGWQEIPSKKISIVGNDHFIFGQDTLYNAQTNETYANLIHKLTRLDSIENLNLIRLMIRGLFLGGMLAFIIWAFSG